MFRVLIVDDEPMVRKRLKTIIDWEQVGFCLVGEACDGEEGLELVKKRNPDLVITDIRMPVINGLELIQKAKEENPFLQAAILSGYNDFEYAQEAMKYGVKHYLLKPIEKDKLLQVLEKIREEISSTRTLHHQLQESMQVLRGKWLLEVLHQRTIDQHMIDRAQGLGMDLFGCKLGLFMLDIDDMDELFIEDRLDEIQLKKDLLLKLIEDIKKDYGEIVLADEGEGRHVVLCIMPQRGQARLKSLVQDLIELARKTGEMTLTIGLGGDEGNLHSIKQNYTMAKEALEYKFLFGKDRIIDYRDLGKGLLDSPWASISEWNHDTILEAVEKYDEKIVKREIDGLFDILRQTKATPVIVHAAAIDILAGIGRIVKKLEGDWSEIAKGNLNLINEMKGKETLDEIKNWLCDLCLQANRYIASLRESRPRKVSEELLEYIEEHYMEDISLKEMAKIVYMNPVYLGQVFKNETGVSFNEYLVNKRVEEACRLLAGSNLNVYEVAERVGYKAPGNFYKAFKKIKGISPADYRTQTRSGKQGHDL